MPIGKNAIKRVENNGYSKVKTSAPDMENSNVIANLDPQVEEKMVAPVEKATKAKSAAKPAAKKTTAKKAPVAKVEEKKEKKTPLPEAKKPATKSASKKSVTSQKTAKKPVQKKTGFERVEVGKDMPYYLL